MVDKETMADFMSEVDEHNEAYKKVEEEIMENTKEYSSILKGLYASGFRYLAKDGTEDRDTGSIRLGELYAYSHKPIKKETGLTDDYIRHFWELQGDTSLIYVYVDKDNEELFNIINATDEEPVEIEFLLTSNDFEEEEGEDTTMKNTEKYFDTLKDLYTRGFRYLAKDGTINPMGGEEGSELFAYTTKPSRHEVEVTDGEWFYHWESEDNDLDYIGDEDTAKLFSGINILDDEPTEIETLLMGGASDEYREVLENVLFSYIELAKETGSLSLGFGDGDEEYGVYKMNNDEPVDFDTEMEDPDWARNKEGHIESLVVFLNSGNTYLFHNVTDLEDSKEGITFSYEGKSTGVKRKATFKHESIAGYAKEEGS